MFCLRQVEKQFFLIRVRSGGVLLYCIQSITLTYGYANTSYSNKKRCILFHRSSSFPFLSTIISLLTAAAATSAHCSAASAAFSGPPFNSRLRRDRNEGLSTWWGNEIAYVETMHAVSQINANYIASYCSKCSFSNIVALALMCNKICLKPTE